MGDNAPHAFHAYPAFSGAHSECFPDCVGHLFDIVGIHQQRIALELLSRAGEVAENQHTVLVDAACAIFLSYEVHSVLQRGDESDLASPVLGQQVLPIEAAKMIMHWKPGCGREASVNVAHQTIDAVLELVISGNLCSTRDNVLDQHDPASQLLIAFECDAKRTQPFRNSLAVIEPIHAKDKLGARKGGA